MSWSADKIPTEAALPLAGVRVIELGMIVAGPFCGSLMADFGAEVIKVEQPGVGDPQRKMGYSKDGVPVWWGVDVREKQCVTLNLKNPEGKALLLRLVESADVLIENFRPGVLARLDLDLEKLRQINPRLIMLSITGFGETGPKSLVPGFGKIAEGMSGIIPLIGTSVADAVFVGFSLGDATAAMFGFFAIQLALYQRDVGGRGGAHIDLALYEALFRMLDCQLALAHTTPGEEGMRHPNNPYAWGVSGSLDELFVQLRCRDQAWLAVLIPDQAISKRIFEAVCEVGGESREVKRHEFESLLLTWALKESVEDVANALMRLGAHVAPVFDGLSIGQNAYFRERSDVISVHTSIGEISVPGPYPKNTEHIARMIRFRPAASGADNDAVFGRHVGLTPTQVKTLAGNGVL